MIAAEGHGLVFRAPYWPVDGAIEYVFNTIYTYLMEYYNSIKTLDELKNHLILIIGQMQNFHRYFCHVGFRYIVFTNRDNQIIMHVIQNLI